MTNTPEITKTERAALGDAIRRARQAAGKGSFAGIAAAVVRGDTVIATGVNEVHVDNDPTRHAEIVALGRAGAALGNPDLTGCTLISTLQPCEMCLSAMRFAGISRVIFAAQKGDVGQKYFVFPLLDIDAFQRAASDPFTAIGGVDQAEVLDLYRDGQE